MKELTKHLQRRIKVELTETNCILIHNLLIDEIENKKRINKECRKSGLSGGRDNYLRYIHRLKKKFEKFFLYFDYEKDSGSHKS